MTEHIIAEVIDCPKCGLVVAREGAGAHGAGHRREGIVAEQARASNIRGIDFERGQRWTAKASARRRAAR